jgi:(2Fe-2S) ferredoxin
MGQPQPAFYILKCQQASPPNMPKPSCVRPDTQDHFQYLSQGLMKRGIIATVQPIQTSCLGRCNAGPVMLVEPGHFMYSAVDKAGIDRIIDEHIINGNPVQDLLIADVMWDKAIQPLDMMKQMGKA